MVSPFTPRRTRSALHTCTAPPNPGNQPTRLPRLHRGMQGPATPALNVRALNVRALNSATDSSRTGPLPYGRPASGLQPPTAVVPADKPDRNCQAMTSPARSDSAAPDQPNPLTSASVLL